MNVQKIDDNGAGLVTGTLDMANADIQIGAVELKDHVTDARAVIAGSALAVMDYEHFLFEKSKVMAISSGELWGSAAAGVINNLFVPTSDVHIEITVDGNADLTFKLLEAPTVSDSGTDGFAPINTDFTVASAVAGTFYVKATLSATGVTKYSRYVPSGVGKFGGGVAQGNTLWGLKAGTVYSFQIIGHAIGTFNISAKGHLM